MDLTHAIVKHGEWSMTIGKHNTDLQIDTDSRTHHDDDVTMDLRIAGLGRDPIKPIVLCDTIKGNESLFEIFNFYFLTPLT